MRQKYNHTDVGNDKDKHHHPCTPVNAEYPDIHCNQQNRHDHRKLHIQSEMSFKAHLLLLLFLHDPFNLFLTTSSYALGWQKHILLIYYSTFLCLCKQRRPSSNKIKIFNLKGPALQEAFCKAGPNTPKQSYALYPSGFCDCHLQESSHISSRPLLAFQPSTLSAFAGSA